MNTKPLSYLSGLFALTLATSTVDAGGHRGGGGNRGGGNRVAIMGARGVGGAGMARSFAGAGNRFVGAGNRFVGPNRVGNQNFQRLSNQRFGNNRNFSGQRWAGNNWNNNHNWSGHWNNNHWNNNWNWHGHHHNNNFVFFDWGFPFWGLWSWGYPYYYDYGYYPYGYYGAYPYGYYGNQYYGYGNGYYGSYNYNYGNGYGYDNGYGNGYSGGYDEKVAELQRRLSNAGYYRGEIDGIWGSRTQYALKAYRHDHPNSGSTDDSGAYNQHNYPNLRNRPYSPPPTTTEPSE